MSSLFFQNASKNLPLFNLPITTSGSNYGITTPWGFILNFGKASIDTSNTDVTFAIAMTNAQYSISFLGNQYASRIVSLVSGGLWQANLQL